MNLTKNDSARIQENKPILCFIKEGKLLVTVKGLTYLMVENMFIEVEAGDELILEVKMLPKKYISDKAIVWLVKSN